MTTVEAEVRSSSNGRRLRDLERRYAMRQLIDPARLQEYCELASLEGLEMPDAQEIKPRLTGGKDANFSVNIETLSWTCFSHCGYGSVVSYLNGGVPARGERFREIVADLARRANVEIEWKTTPDSPEVQACLRRRELLEGFAVLAQRQLNGPEATPAIDYLASRGFPADARELSRLGLGYIPNSVHLYEALNTTAAEASSNGLEDLRWRSRVIIPWRDRAGHVATFLGRSIQPEPQIRYIYLRGAVIPPFFGFERVQLGTADSLLIVESPLDAVLLWHHGVDHVVAVGGSMLTVKHLDVLRQYGTRTVILALDADDAGRTATDRFLTLVATDHPVLRVHIVPPDGFGGANDPGEYIVQRGGAAVQDLIDARMPAAVYQAAVVVREVHPSSPLAVRRDALDRLISIGYGIAGRERLADVEDIVQVAAPRLGYPEAVVRAAVGATPLPTVVRPEGESGFSPSARGLPRPKVRITASSSKAGNSSRIGAGIDDPAGLAARSVLSRHRRRRNSWRRGPAIRACRLGGSR